jgi:hypothetical protein
MELKNGKFYKDGKEVPIEIGNKEQIKLLRNALKDLDKGVEIDLRIDEIVKYTTSFSYTCPCCFTKNNEDVFEDEDDEPSNGEIDDEILGWNYCIHCKTEFEIVKDGKDGIYRNKYFLKLADEDNDN